MIREVDLISYLPPYMANFKEIAVTLEAENPEFTLVWKATDRLLYNEFIETADEYGISRFENILGILPSSEDTLDSRRARVQARWFDTIPYTLRAFIAKLAALSGDNDFTVTKYYDYYRVDLLTQLEMFGQVDELKHMIENMFPCNIIVKSRNIIPCDSNGFAFIAGGVAFVQDFFITNDSNETLIAKGSVLQGGGAVNSATVLITNDFNEKFNINGENHIGSGVSISEIVGIKQN